MNFDIVALKPLIVDAVVVAIMLIFALAHGKKGLYNEIMPYVVFVFALVTGVFSSRTLAPIVSPFANGFIEEKIAGKYEGIGVQFIDDIAADLINKKLDVISEKIVQIALFIICTLIAWIILAIIKKAFGAVADWSAIGLINHGLGFIFGLAEAFLLILLALRVTSMLNITTLTDLSKDTLILNWIHGVDLKELINDITIYLKAFEAFK